MHFKAFSAAVFGIDAYLVEVEVDVGSGKPGDFNVVGLPDIAVKESRERIKAALKNCGHDFPVSERHRQSCARRYSQGRLGVRSADGAFDSRAARARSSASGSINLFSSGELSLDGQVRSVRGALSAALAAREHKITRGRRAGSECARGGGRRGDRRVRRAQCSRRPWI